MNPLGEETSVMRTTLIPNMLDVISTNISHKVEEVIWHLNVEIHLYHKKDIQ